MYADLSELPQEIDQRALAKRVLHVRVEGDRGIFCR